MPKQPTDRLEKEATRIPAAVTEVDWEGVAVKVLPSMKWKASGVRALREGDIDMWAEKCLAPESYKLWQQVDPDLEQCEAFFEAWQDASGESRPESVTSPA